MALSKRARVSLVESTFRWQFFISRRSVGVHEVCKGRDKHGEYHHLFPILRKHESRFFDYTRMSTTTFDYIFSLVKDDLEKQTTNWRRPIGAEERLVLTLREEFEEQLPYTNKLKTMDRLLQEELVLDEEVDQVLGTSIAALHSVPTAIYCFLRSQTPIPKIEQTDCPFRRTIQYAISLGGDTDTIASMAGAIAGAYYGIEVINKSLQKHCEFVDETINLANQIVEITSVK